MMTPIATLAILFGSTLEIASIGMQANAAKKEAEFNAAQAEQDAAYIEEQTTGEVKKYRKSGERFMGTQRAIAGASAAEMAGSPLMIMKETADTVESGAREIQKQGTYEANRLRQQAGQYRQGAKDIAVAGLFDISSSFLTKLARYKWKKNDTGQYYLTTTQPEFALFKP